MLFMSFFCLVVLADIVKRFRLGVGNETNSSGERFRDRVVLPVLWRVGCITSLYYGRSREGLVGYSL